jgi:hypothetical protein
MNLLILLALALQVDTSRPDPAGTPTKVEIGLHVLDLKSIDDVAQTFTADVLVSVEWTDPRLADAAKTGERMLPLLAVWHPVVAVVNQSGASPQLPNLAIVWPDGRVALRQRFTGGFSVPLDLRDFPLDAHSLPIRIVLGGVDATDLAVEVSEEMGGLPGEITLAGWSAEWSGIEAGTFSLPGLRTTAMFTARVRVTRDRFFYVLRMIGPLVLIVLIAWGTLWVAATDTGAQIRLGATGFLTLVAYQFAIAGLLPNVSYLTRMDLFLAGSSLIIFLALGKSLFCEHLLTKEKGATVERVHAIGRWVFLAAFLVVIVAAFVA